MQVEYDHVADAFYFRLKGDKVSESIEQTPHKQDK
jgi:uncharacterized protein YuzE